MNKVILLVEDSEDDVFLMQRALKTAGFQGSVQVVEDGQAAVDYFGGQHQYADRSKFPVPDVVLLDLKLPQLPGLDVLSAMREHRELGTTPVVVLTSSRQESDIIAAYQRGASAFIVKPTSSEQRADFVKHLIGFWLNFNEPPIRSRR
jgi:DNA-binding response OmpR family regulator